MTKVSKQFASLGYQRAAQQAWLASTAASALHMHL